MAKLEICSNFMSYFYGQLNFQLCQSQTHLEIGIQEVVRRLWTLVVYIATQLYLIFTSPYPW